MVANSVAPEWNARHKAVSHWGWRRKANQIRPEEKDILDGFGMRKQRLTAGEELLELIMLRYGRASTLVSFEPTDGGLGQVTGWCRRTQRHARPPPAPWIFSEVRPTRLAS